VSFFKKLTHRSGVHDVPRVVWVLAAGRVVTSATSFAMLFLTLYLTGPRELSLGHAGLVAGSVGAGMLLGNFTGGRWGDRHGHRRVLLLASTLSGVGLVCVPALPVPALAVVFPLVGYLGATAGISQGALAALAVPVGERRTSVAISRAASNGGFVVGPPLGALLATVSFDALFVVEGVMMLLVRVITSRLLPAGTDAHVGAVAPTGPGMWRSVLADRSLLALLPAIVMVDIVYRQLYTTLPVYLRDHGQPLGLYAALIATGSGLILLLEVPVAVRLRRLPASPILAAGYALVGIGFGVLALVPLGLGIALAAVAAMIVLTVGEILYKTTATARVLDAAPEHLVGQYQGLYTGLATSGTLLAAPLGAWLYAAWPDAVWPFCLVGCLVGAGLALRSGRDRGRLPEPATTPG
jgi:MFS family permease